MNWTTDLISFNRIYENIFVSVQRKSGRRNKQLTLYTKKLYHQCIEKESEQYRKLMVLCSTYLKYYYYWVGYIAQLTLYYEHCMACWNQSRSKLRPNSFWDKPYQPIVDCRNCYIKSFCQYLILRRRYTKYSDPDDYVYQLNLLREQALAYGRSIGIRTLYRYLPRLEK